MIYNSTNRRVMVRTVALSPEDPIITLEIAAPKSQWDQLLDTLGKVASPGAYDIFDALSNWREGRNAT